MEEVKDYILVHGIITNIKDKVDEEYIWFDITRNEYYKDKEGKVKNNPYFADTLHKASTIVSFALSVPSVTTDMFKIPYRPYQLTVTVVLCAAIKVLFMGIFSFLRTQQGQLLHFCR